MYPQQPPDGSREPGMGGPERLPPPKLRFEVAFDSVGRTPDTNQDEMLYMPDGLVMAVFDGPRGHKYTGSHNPGALARTVVSEGLTDAPVVSTVEDEDARVRRALDAANETLYLENIRSDIDLDLASTVALARVWSTSEGRWHSTIGSLGDSRVYLFRAGRLEMLTLDHSLQDMNEELSSDQLWEIQKHLANYGDPSETVVLTEFEKSCFEARKGIGQALGLDAAPDFRVRDIEVLAGDLVIVMGDGPPDNLTTLEMERLIAEGGSVAEIVSRLIEAARLRAEDKSNVRAGLDDMTVLAMEALNDDEGGVTPIA